MYIEILRKAHPQFDLLAAKLGVAGHSEKRIVAAGTAYLDEPRTLDFGGAAIQYKVIFEDLPIACVTDGGRAFIDEFRNQQVAHIKVLCACLQSLGHLLDHLLDACTIFLHSISRKLVNLHADWLSCTERVQYKHWFEWAEKACSCSY